MHRLLPAVARKDGCAFQGKPDEPGSPGPFFVSELTQEFPVPVEDLYPSISRVKDVPLAVW